MIMSHTAQKLRMSVEDWAAEAAQADLGFCNPSVLQKLSAEDRKAIAEGLIFYARNAAARTFDSLKLHGYLNLS
jgi:hypothetical protein